MFMFVLNILCHNLLGTNNLEDWVRTKRLSLGTNRLGANGTIHGYEMTGHQNNKNG